MTCSIFILPCTYTVHTMTSLFISLVQHVKEGEWFFWLLSLSPSNDLLPSLYFLALNTRPRCFLHYTRTVFSVAERATEDIKRERERWSCKGILNAFRECPSLCFRPLFSLSLCVWTWYHWRSKTPVAHWRVKRRGECNFPWRTEGVFIFPRQKCSSYVKGESDRALAFVIVRRPCWCCVLVCCLLSSSSIWTREEKKNTWKINTFALTGI